MPKYIALLRGINVSGKNIIKMEALKQLCSQLGFLQIQTYIQSGNLIFEAEQKDHLQLASEISAAIAKEYGYHVPTIVLSIETLTSIANNNPYINENKDASFMHITFLGTKPKSDADIQIQAKLQADEAYSITPNAVYLYCPSGYGNTKLTNQFLEKQLGAQATTRNWKTIQTLIQLAKK